MFKSIIAAIGTKATVAITSVAAVAAAAAITVAVVFTGEESYRVLKVFELNGTAAITRESAGELDAYEGMNLESGDIVTVNSGTMRLSLDSNKYILLEEGTVLELVAEGTATDSKTTLNLREGAILNEITEPLSTNSLYEVNAPKSTMAVRGTSFYVSARKQEDGSYIIDVTTFHGKVSTQLYDENGNKKGKEIIVSENQSTKIKNENTGSGHPETDGTAYFVIVDNETGELRPVADGETPTYDTVYIDVPDEIKDLVLKSDDTNLLSLSEEVLAAIRGLSEEINEQPAETTTTTTTQTGNNRFNVEEGEEGHGYVEIEETPLPEGSDLSVSIKSNEIRTESTTATSTKGSVYLDDVEVDGRKIMEENRLGAHTSTTTTKKGIILDDTTTTTPARIAVVNPDATVTSAGIVNTIFPIGTKTPLKTTMTEVYTLPIKTTKKISTTTTLAAPRLTNIDLPSKTTTTPVYTLPSGFQILTTTTSNRPSFTFIIPTNTTTTSVETTTTTTPPTQTTTTPPTQTTPATADTVVTTTTPPVEVTTTTPAETAATTTTTTTPEETTTTTTTTTAAETTTTTTTTAATTTTTTTTEAVPETVNVVFDYNDGVTEAVTTTVTVGETIGTIPAVPDKTGYTGKWVIIVDGVETELTADMQVLSDTNVTLRYTAIKYTVTFEGEDGTTLSTANADYDTTLAASDIPTVPEKTGHTGKWVISGTTTEFTTSTKITGATTVKPSYTAIEYTVTFTKEDGSTLDTAKADYDTTLAASAIPGVPSKTGYTGKWVVDGVEFTTSTKITDDTTVTLSYTAIKYTVTFTKEDGTTLDTANADYDTTLAASDIPAVPEKTGHTGKWIISGTTTEFTTSTKITGATTVKPSYTAIEYTVTFTKEDGTTLDTANANYDTTLAASDIPAVPEKTGHTGKWVISGTTTEFTTSTKITGATTVAPSYTAIEYTVTFTKEDGTSTTVKADYGTTVAASYIPTIPDKSGYTGKWVLSDGTEFTTATVIKGETNVTLSYSANSYSMIFDFGDEETASITRTVTIGEPVGTLPTIPDKTGWTAGKWVYTDYSEAESDVTLELTETTIVTYGMVNGGKISVSVSRTSIVYTVNFIASYATDVIIATQTGSYNDAIEKINFDDAEYSGKEAVDTDGDGTMDYMVWGWDDTTIPDKITKNEDITVPYIEYNKIVEVRINTGTEYVSELLKAGTTYELPEKPTNYDVKETGGYVFKCWTGNSGTISSSIKPGRTSFNASSCEIEGGGTLALAEGSNYDISPTFIKVNGLDITVGSGAGVAKGSSTQVTVAYSDLSGYNTVPAYSGDIIYTLTGYTYDDSGITEVDLSEGTTITSDGILTVASDETASAVKITAKSTKFNVENSYMPSITTS